MTTTLYFIRHAQSEFIEGKERERGLTASGQAAAYLIADQLKHTKLDFAYCSPYVRAIETVKPLLALHNLSLQLVEDLRERSIGDFEPFSFLEAKKQVYDDFYFSFKNGESSHIAQARAIKEIKTIIKLNEHKSGIIGTHGDIFSLILNYYNSDYHYSFWESTSMPDIYKLVFIDGSLDSCTRFWNV